MIRERRSLPSLLQPYEVPWRAEEAEKPVIKGIGARIDQPIYRAVAIVNSLRLIPHVVIMLRSRNSWLIKSDLARWAKIHRLAQPQKTSDYIWLFVRVMTFERQYRNLFYMRAGIPSRLFSWMCPRLPDLDIVSPKIGPGLFIQHGNSTFVSAKSIGENCWIGRHVVVGYSNETDYPTIGNNVRIYPGAKIIGNITIGDNATIGLNSVVINDVPADVTVLGIPARVVWPGGAKPSRGEVA